MLTLETMSVYGRVWLTDMVILTMMIRDDACCNCAITTHYASWTLFANTQMCTSTLHLVQRFVESTVTHWFLHGISLHSPFNVPRSWQRVQNCRVVNTCWSAACTGWATRAYSNMQGTEILPSNMGDFAVRGVTRLDGARGKKQVCRTNVRTWGLSKANVM